MQNRRNTVYSLLILSLLTGLFTGRSFFFNLAYMFIGLLSISLLWSWLAVRWISIGRKTRARRAQVGRTLDEVFIVRNRSFLPKLWLEVRDHSNLPGHRASNVVPALAGRSSFRWYVQTLCLARGEFQLGPLTLVSGDPFGLFLSPRILNSTSSVIVYPATLPIKRFQLPVGMLSGGETQRRRAQYVTTNAAGVREYAVGDSFNRIHWPSSARKSRLMVKEFEIDPVVDIWLLIDFSAASLVEEPSVKRIRDIGPVISTNQGLPASTEEYGVVVAASLAQYFIESDRALGFTAYTPYREVFQPERGIRQLNRILHTLAVARSMSPFSLMQLLELETVYLGRGTTLVIITASVDLDWVASVQVLARRGMRPLCILIDPELFGGSKSVDEVVGVLRLSKVPTLVVRKGDDIVGVLGQSWS